MSVQASQLIARVSTEGVDIAKSQLQGMGQAARDASSSVGSGGLFGAVTGAIGGILNFGAQVGMTIFGLKNLASGAISLGSSLLQPAATAETTQLSFETLLHSTKAAHQEMMDLNTFAASTPMQTQWVDNAAAKILAFGGTTKDVIPEITAIGDSLSGLGKLSDASLNSIVDIFGKISAQGKLTGGDMMQLSTWGIPAWQALSDAMHKPIPELQKMVSAGLIPADTAIKALEGGMEKTFGGGMAKQANTFTGIISTLASNWQIAMAALGTPVLKLVEGQLSSIGGILSSSAFQDFATNVGQGIANVFTGIGNAASYVGNVLTTLNLSSFKEAWQNIEGLLQDIQGRIEKGLAPAFSLLKTDADPVEEVIQRLAKGGLAVLSNLLWGVEGALLDLDKGLATGRGGFADFGNNLKQFEPPLKDISNLLKGQFVDSFKFAGEQAKQIGTWFAGSGIVQNMAKEFQNLVHVTLDLAEIFLRARGVIMDVEEHAFAKFAPYIEKILPPLIKLGTEIDTGVAKALQYVRPYIDQALQAFEKFADGVIDRTAPIIDKVMPYIILGVEEVQKMWVASWPYMQQILEGTFQSIVGIVQIAWSLVSGIINIGLDLMSGNWVQAWTDMKDMLGGILDGIKNAIGGQLQAWSGLLSGIEGIVNTYLVKPFQNALGSIGGVFSAIGKLISDATTLNFGAIPGDLHSLGIPGFASGTDYAPGGVAILGERGPELTYLPRGTRVVPNNQLQQMSASSAPTGGGQPIIFTIDGHVFARGYMPYHVQAIRSGVGVRF